MQTIAQCLSAAVCFLKRAGIEGAGTDARVLLAHALHLDRGRLTLHLPDPMPKDAMQHLDKMLAARARHQPVAQITGQRVFCGHLFRVTPEVLDPRPETESLVRLALAAPFRRVLDLGTGSGCILLSLLAERPQAGGVGADLSESALNVARENAERLGISAAVFVRSDWFSNIRGKFDLIVSNPPYISDAEWPAVAADVRNWEPRMALAPGGDGLGAYRRICAKAPDFLGRNGRLIVETGATQTAAISAMFRKAGLVNVEISKDMNGHDRVVVGCVPDVCVSGRD